MLKKLFFILTFLLTALLFIAAGMCQEDLPKEFVLSCKPLHFEDIDKELTSEPINQEVTIVKTFGSIKGIVIVYYNKFDKTWTEVYANNGLACILMAGVGIQVRDDSGEQL